MAKAKAPKPEKPKKVWKGERLAGPKPARHIPWPELFRHHLSSLEGHCRMLEMVQKHTAPDTENWRTITPIVERSQQMIRDFKLVQRIFAPKEDTFKQVPLGSSSETVYPGYHPGDYKYGEAAQEAGQARAAAAAAATAGVPDRFSRLQDGLKRKRGPSDQNGQTNGDADNVDQPAGGVGEGVGQPAGEATDINAAAGGDNPYFVIDTKPTPVNIPQRPKPGDEKPREGQTELKSNDKRKSKKQKTDKADKEAPTAEFEDISGEVDARLKEKEEKKKRKEEKKRKRESTGTGTGTGVPSNAVEMNGAVQEKPTKSKRPRKAESEGADAEKGKSDKKKKRETKDEKDKKRKDADLQEGGEESRSKKKRKGKGAKADEA